MSCNPQILEIPRFYLGYKERGMRKTSMPWIIGSFRKPHLSATGYVIFSLLVRRVTLISIESGLGILNQTSGNIKGVLVSV